MTQDTIERKRLSHDVENLPMQFRAFNVDRAAINEADRTVELSFSSEEPYERWFGVEILDHGKKAMRMDRLKSGAALLMDHNMRDQVGVVERAWVGDDKRGRAVVRFSKSARASEIFQDITDGIRGLVSVGYAVHEMVLEKSTDQMDTYRVTDWEPYEISIVAVPADATVGIGRAHGNDPVFEARITRAGNPPPQGTPQGVTTMEVKDNAPAGAAADTKPAMTADTALKLERARCDYLSRLGEENCVDAGVVRGWIESGTSVDEAGRAVVRIHEERAKNNEVVGNLGMSKKETEQYSLLRAIGAALDQNWKKAGIEYEAHNEIQKRLNRPPQSNNAFYVPFDVQARSFDTRNEELARRMAKAGRRDLTVATASGAGYLVGTSNQGFIELFRNATVLYALGARRLGGLTDSITIPRQSSGATAYWLSTEATAITESALVLGQLALSPKNVGAYTEISRQLTLQANPDVEQLVMADLAAQVAIDVDAKGINGSGSSGQPTGLLNTSGIGSVTGSSIALAGIIEFQSDVFGANVPLANAGYLTTAAVAAILMARARISSTDSRVLWEGALEMGEMVGKKAMASNQMPSATLAFGEWSEIMIAEWGVLEVDVNPYAGFTAGIIGVRAMAAVDIGVRHPGAFSVATSVS